MARALIRLQTINTLTQIVWSREAEKILAMQMYTIAADDIVDLSLQYSFDSV